MKSAVNMKKLWMLVVIIYNIQPCWFAMTFPENPHPKWYENAVIYQIFVPSFKDSNGDGIGDLYGILEKEQYLANLGVEALLLSPVYKSANNSFSYGSVDFKEVDPALGSLRNIDQIVGTFGLHSIKVLLDFEASYSSIDHPWFQQSVERIEPFTDLYIWANGAANSQNPDLPSPPNEWKSKYGKSAWTWNDKRKQFYLHQFSPIQPDFNYTNPLLRNKMKEMLKFWLDRGIDGFRILTPPYVIKDYMITDQTGRNLLETYTNNQPESYHIISEWRAIIEEVNRSHRKVTSPILIIEGSENLEATMKYYSKDVSAARDFMTGLTLAEETEKYARESLIGDLRAHFPTNVDFLRRINDFTSNQQIENLVDNWLVKMPRGVFPPNWMVGSTSESRMVKKVGRNQFDLFMMMLLLLPGTVLIKYGDEIGMTDGYVSFEQGQDIVARQFDRYMYNLISKDSFRTPMQWDSSPLAGFTRNRSSWLPINDDYYDVNVRSQEERRFSHLKLFKMLSKLRREPVLKKGSLITSTFSSPQVYGILRSIDHHQMRRFRRSLDLNGHDIEEDEYEDDEINEEDEVNKEEDENTAAEEIDDTDDIPLLNYKIEDWEARDDDSRNQDNQNRVKRSKDKNKKKSTTKKVKDVAKTAAGVYVAHKVTKKLFKRPKFKLFGSMSFSFEDSSSDEFWRRVRVVDSRYEGGDHDVLFVANFGMTGVTQDLTLLERSRQTMMVYAASIGSQYKTGRKVDIRHFTLEPQSAVVLVGPRLVTALQRAARIITDGGETTSLCRLLLLLPLAAMISLN